MEQKQPTPSPTIDETEAAKIREQQRANQQQAIDDMRRQQNEIHDRIMRQVFGEQQDT